MTYRVGLLLCLVAANLTPASAQVLALNPRYTSPNNIGSDEAPSITYVNGKMYLGWESHHKLHIVVSSDLAVSFSRDYDLQSDYVSNPSLASYAGRLFVAWKDGGGDIWINEVHLDSSGMPTKLDTNCCKAPRQSSSHPPQLFGTDQGMFIVWKGKNNGNLNIGQVSIAWPPTAVAAVVSDTPEKMFRDLENQISHAVMTKDASAMNNLFSTAYTSVGVSGRIRSRAEVIDAYTSGRLVITKAETGKIGVRQYGDFAVVVGEITVSGKEGSRDISGRYAFTRVYKRDAGKWPAVSFQATPVK